MIRRLRQQPFASIVQAILPVLMLISFVLIAQHSNQALYHVGFILLIASTFVQIVFGNIPPEAGLKRSMTSLGIGLATIAAIFALGILLAPYLVNLGRR